MITFKEAVQFNYFHVKIRRQNLQCQDFLYIVVYCSLSTDLSIPRNLNDDYFKNK